MHVDADLARSIVVNQQWRWNAHAEFVQFVEQLDEQLVQWRVVQFVIAVVVEQFQLVLAPFGRIPPRNSP